MKNGKLINIFHILFVGSFFLYLGIKRTNLPDIIYPILIFFGIILILHHAYKAYKTKGNIINLIHVIFIGPLLIYIGIQKKKTPIICFDILILLAFASIGYHSYKLLQKE
jgi:Na+-transporting methylmalonyl-CoA/oxaloacetate decarboxylase beta subunit